MATVDVAAYGCDRDNATGSSGERWTTPTNWSSGPLSNASWCAPAQGPFPMSTAYEWVDALTPPTASRWCGFATAVSVRSFTRLQRRRSIPEA